MHDSTPLVQSLHAGDFVLPGQGINVQFDFEPDDLAGALFLRVHDPRVAKRDRAHSRQVRGQA